MKNTLRTCVSRLELILVLPITVRIVEKTLSACNPLRVILNGYIEIEAYYSAEAKCWLPPARHKNLSATLRARGGRHCVGGIAQLSSNGIDPPLV